MTQQTKRVEAYTFVEFCKAYQEAIQDGFAVDFKDSLSIPSASIGYYKCNMYKGQKLAALLKPKPEPEPPVEPAAEPYSPPAVPFVPSVVFEAVTAAPKPKGRPKANRV